MPLTLEQEVAALTSSATANGIAIAAQQVNVDAKVAAFAATTSRVNALNLVENRADIDKPISTATAQALLGKQASLVSGVGGNMATVNGKDLLLGGDVVIPRSATSRNSITYDNRGTLRSTVSQVDDSTGVEGLGLFQWTDTQLEPDDDETCFNTPAVSTLVGVPLVLTVTTPAGQWLLREPAIDLIDAWNLFDQAVTDDWREDEPKRFAAYLLANK
jgi:hypothetical protein